MKTHSYTSFDDINKHLKILRLQREIDVENMKLNFKKSKDYLCPTNLLGGFSSMGGFSGLLQNIVAPLVANILITKLLKKKSMS